MKLVERTAELFTELARLIGKSGSRIRPFEESSLPIYSNLDFENQTKIAALLEDIVDFFNEAFADGVDPLNSSELLRRSLLHFDWKPISDIYDYIEPDDTIELCNLTQVTVFRNLQSFKFVSLTLEQLYCLPWHQFSRRSEQDAALIAGAVRRIFSEEVRGTLSLTELPEQLLEEVNTPELRKLNVRFKCMSPVHSGGKLVAVIVVHHTTLV